MRGIRKITPYVAGEQPNFPDMVKINTNENAYPPSPKVAEALKKFETEGLRKYSSLSNQELTCALAEKWGLPEEYFLVGNGSDEILAFCFLAFFQSELPVFFPDITYGFYKVWANLFQVPFCEISLTERLEIDLKDYEQENGGIILANPNAPTGIYKNEREMVNFIEKHPDSIILVDEAYIEFGGESLARYTKEYDHLVVVHTLSKGQSLAGLRVGYAVANPKLIDVLQAVKSSFNPYSVDLLAENLATVAIYDNAYYKGVNEKIQQTREWLVVQLQQRQFSTLPSQTNFILTKKENLSAKALFDYLKKEKIFVRYFEKPEKLSEYLRISIGTKEEMKKVVEAIDFYLEKQPEIW